MVIVMSMTVKLSKYTARALYVKEFIRQTSKKAHVALPIYIIEQFIVQILYSAWCLCAEKLFKNQHSKEKVRASGGLARTGFG